MTRDFSEHGRIVVLGIGNSLLSDDGAGVHVISLLQMRPDIASNVVFRDGGTLGLSLLPEIEDTDGLIVVDAAEIGLTAGSVKTFEDAAVHAQLGGTKKTVHELALSDLMSAAALTGRAPRHVALVTIQPQSTDWGTEPTPAVMAALPEACEAVVSVMEKWQA
ncbi:MAG: HyaD/HybD family hydrogenase maturation endopeptidase, partial [Hyphomicrobiales bacterium]|nr:HyaD/HybD family hydrogenase maturation endopeptidase [Hyphomicrobiales bacterium]